MSVRVKDGCKFDVIAPAGFRILRVIDYIAEEFQTDITITSGTDGVHPAGGAQDPHYLGEAYDIRTHDLWDKEAMLLHLEMYLGEKFYAFIEFPGEPSEHIHIQLRNGVVFT